MARRQEIYQPRRIVGDSIEALRFQLQEELDRIGEVIIQLAEMKYLPQAEQPPKYDDGSMQFFVDGVSVEGIASTEEGLHQFRDLNWFRMLDSGNLAANGGTIPETDRDNTFNGNVTIIGSGQNSIVTTGPPGSNTVLEIGHQNEASITAIDLHCSGNNNDHDVRIRADNTGGDGTVGGARLQLNAQVVLGNPTGNTQGKGTLNAQAVYDDGTLLTDYVFDAELDQRVDTEFYNRAVPDRETKDENGKVLRTEKRVHTPARQFSQNMDELDPKEFERKWRSSRKLPAMARAPEKPSLGEYAQALLETCEVQATHIAKLEARISALEEKQT